MIIKYDDGDFWTNLKLFRQCQWWKKLFLCILRNHISSSVACDINVLRHLLFPYVINPSEHSELAEARNCDLLFKKIAKIIYSIFAAPNGERYYSPMGYLRELV